MSETPAAQQGPHTVEELIEQWREGEEYQTTQRLKDADELSRVYAQEQAARVERVTQWIENCAEYEGQHEEEGNKIGHAYYRGAKEAYRRVLDILKGKE
jgi:hypothetical protein